MRAQSESGYSLAEILVSLALVALVAAGAMFRYGPTARRLTLHSAARRLAGDLRMAQQRAILDGAPWVWLSDTDAYGYTLNSTGVPCVDQGVQDVRFDERTTVRLASPPSPMCITFAVTGHPTGGSDVSLVLTNGMDLSYVCLRATGRVDIAAKNC